MQKKNNKKEQKNRRRHERCKSFGQVGFLQLRLPEAMQPLLVENSLGRKIPSDGDNCIFSRNTFGQWKFYFWTVIIVFFPKEVTFEYFRTVTIVSLDGDNFVYGLWQSFLWTVTIVSYPKRSPVISQAWTLSKDIKTKIKFSLSPENKGEAWWVPRVGWQLIGRASIQLWRCPSLRTKKNNKPN